MNVIKLVAGSVIWVLCLAGFLVLLLFGLVPPRSVRDRMPL